MAKIIGNTKTRIEIDNSNKFELQLLMEFCADYN